MKRLCLILSLSALILLSSCRMSSPGSSSVESSAPGSVSSDVSSSSLPASSSSAVSSQSAVSSSESVPVESETEYQLSVTTSGGNPVTLTLNVPSSWQNDGSTVFTDSASGIKCMEVAAVYEITDSANPITSDMVAPFQSGYEGMEGFSDMIHGVSSANGRPMEYYRTSSTPDGADFTWYTFFTFSYDDSYVYQLHFFTTEPDAGIYPFFDVIASAHAE